MHSRAKTPDVTISNFELSEEILATSKENSTSPEIAAALKSHPNLKSEVQNLLKFQETGTAKRVGEFFKIERLVEINSKQDSDPQNNSPVYQNEISPVDLEQKQKQDEDKKQVVQWLSTGCNINLTYASYDIKKYQKNFERPELRIGIIYRKCFDDTKKLSHRQACIAKHLKSEVSFRIHNALRGGHSGINRTAQEFRKRFYFPGFTDFLERYVRNCQTCLTVIRAPNSSLRAHLEPMSSELSFPGDTMQTDLVGQFSGSMYPYALSGIDIVTKYLFAVPLTSPSAAAVAKALVLICFNTVTFLKQF